MIVWMWVVLKKYIWMMMCWMKETQQRGPFLNISAWAHLGFDKTNETTVKITRYNQVPDHLVGTGVALIHCDSSFLPGSVGVGAGKEDLKKILNFCNFCSELWKWGEETPAISSLLPSAHSEHFWEKAHTGPSCSLERKLPYASLH